MVKSYVSGLGSRSRSKSGVFDSGARAAWKKNQEPEPLWKKLGAGAPKKLAGSSVLREEKKHKEIVL